MASCNYHAHWSKNWKNIYIWQERLKGNNGRRQWLFNQQIRGLILQKLLLVHEMNVSLPGFLPKSKKAGRGKPTPRVPHLQYLKALMEKGALFTRRCFPVTRFICFISEHKETDQMSRRNTQCSQVSCTLGATVQGGHVAPGGDDGQVVMIFHHWPICHVVKVQGPCFLI